MKQFRTHLGAVVLAIGIVFTLVGHSQPPKKGTVRPGKFRPSATPKKTDPAEEKARLEAAMAASTPAEKAELLVKFISDYPKSDSLSRAQESLAGARAAMADEKLSSGDAEGAVKLFKLAVDEAPKPYSDRLFGSVLSTIPGNLFWRGQRQEAIEIARAMEPHIAVNANQLVILSTFYLGIENGADAKRLAEAAVKVSETNSAAHQALASAHRLNFDLEAAAASFARAVELEPEATTAKRSLADMKRALGKADEAEAIYREILAKNEKEQQARTGLVLSMFENGKKAEAEAELAKSLVENPGNVVLLAGAAYWYAASGDGAIAVDYANRAIAKDPRFIWSHIALSRGLMLQKKPVEAEQALIAARKYGNFPTLQYEIASARLSAGFFQEAAEELKKSFSIDNGTVKTSLGGRIERSGETFSDAISLERRASIFAPNSADTTGNGSRLKALLELDQMLAAEKKDEAEIASAAERFAAGDDNMAVHRQLYAANLLLEKGVANERAFELARSAMARVDSSLDVASPGAAVMASELYEARNVSFARNDYLLIPEVPRQTLNALMRGRVEETTGLALLKQGKPEEATVRFRRALTVFPKDSAWWRSATWNLGTALAAQGQDKEGLDALMSSYKVDKPNIGRYLVIESLYRKVNGNLDGLDGKIGPNPLPNFTGGQRAADVKSTAETSAAPAEPEPKKSDASEAKLPETLPATVGVTKTEASPSPEPSVSPAVTPIVEITLPIEQKKPEPTPETAALSTPVNPPFIETKTETPKVEARDVKAESTPEPKPADVLIERKPIETPPTPAPETSPSPEASETKTVEDVKPKTVVSEPGKDAAAEKSDSKKDAEAPKPEDAKSDEPVKVTKGPEKKPAVVVTGTEPMAKAINKTGANSGVKPLFEPIVISVGKNAERSAEPEPIKPEPKPERKAAEVVISDGLARPRIIDGKPVTQEADACTIGVSQENFSLLRNGGNAAVLVSIDIGRDAKAIKAVSSSPTDIDVRSEPDLIEVPSRSLFAIRSVSRKAGLYQVSFAAPCGKKDVTVRVR